MNAYREPAEMPPEPPPQKAREPWWTKEKAGYAILACTALGVGIFADANGALLDYLRALGLLAVLGAVVTGVIFILDARMK